MSRLGTFFSERPYLVAAAFSRGGIAWRIAREVLGIEKSVEAVLKAHPAQKSFVDIGQEAYWCHKISEAEWFYLVGGYEMLTGLWFLLSVLCHADS